MRDDHCGAAMISAKPVSYQSIIKSLSFLYGLSLPVTSLRFVVLALHGSDLVEGFPPSRHCTYKVLACSQPFFARAVRAYMRALAPSQKKEASAGGVI